MGDVKLGRPPPIPPRELLNRIGGPGAEESDEWFRDFYVTSGRSRRDGVVAALPEGYSFEGRRVLDFGCGAGRVLRHFLPEAEDAEFWGCDLHPGTVAWLDQHLSPPMRFYVNDEDRMPHPDDYFDLVYTISVFTHITHEWSKWLLELHRILRPGGLLLATIVGPEAWGPSLPRPFAESQLGMCAQRLGQRLDDTSGPRILHSPWWLRSHWGRAFEIVKLEGAGFAGGRPGQGFVLGRKIDVQLTRDDLERPDPRDPREVEAQRNQLVVLEDEAVEARRRLLAAQARGDRLTKLLKRTAEDEPAYRAWARRLKAMVTNGRRSQP